MKTDIEQYIKQNRQRMDSAIPDDEAVWQGISMHLDRKKNTMSIIWKAAAILLIFLSVGSVSIYSVNRTLHTQPDPISLKDISQELAIEERESRALVLEKMEEINNRKLDPALAVELYTELHQLDLQYAAYFKDLQELGNNPKVIRGLIRCYTQKIKILEKTLKENEKHQHHEQDENME
jgi:hypothetical protein